MDKLKYKTFVWPHNPTVYKEEYLREPQYYKGDDGEYYFDAMGDEKLTITGTGAFFGDDAFVQFKKLAKLFKETTPGNLEHPIWGIRYCYLTGLEMTQEPKDNYVSYRFTFTGAQTNGVVPRQWQKTLYGKNPTRPCGCVGFLFARKILIIPARTRRCRADSRCPSGRSGLRGCRAR